MHFLKMNLKKLQEFNQNYFRGKSHFENDGTVIFYFSQYSDIFKGLIELIMF